MALPAEVSHLSKFIAVPRLRQCQVKRPLQLRNIILVCKQQLLQRHFELIQQQNQLIVAGIIVPAFKAREVGAAHNAARQHRLADPF
ncbi:hypothetical protein D3C81_1949410 [compost metagenome]